MPANPFSEVSDGAIEYFVEWSLERSTAPASEAAANNGTAFGAVEMRPPEQPAAEVELRSAGRRGATRGWVPCMGRSGQKVGAGRWSRVSARSGFSQAVSWPARAPARR